MLKGQAVARALTGSDVRVFARRRFGAHPQLPLLLSNAGLNRALFIAFDDAMVPQYQTTVVNWPAPDGKQVDCFTRVPFAADRAETFFNLAHHLFKTIREDHYATVALLRRGEPAAPWYRDWLELSRFGPVMGQWTTFSRYFNDVMAGMTPGLRMRVDNKLSEDGGEMAVDLKFNSIEDFEPARVAEQVPALKALLETRAKLRDLMSKVDRSEELEGLLEQVLKNETELKSLSSQLGLDKKEG